MIHFLWVIQNYRLKITCPQNFECIFLIIFSTKIHCLILLYYLEYIWSELNLRPADFALKNPIDVWDYHSFIIMECENK